MGGDCRQYPGAQLSSRSLVLGRVRKTRDYQSLSQIQPRRGLWKSKNPSKRLKHVLFWICLDAVEMRRGNEVGTKVMPSLEVAGNNIFQYFLVSAIANARLEVFFEVLEHLQYNVICVFLKTSSVKIDHFGLATR